ASGCPSHAIRIGSLQFGVEILDAAQIPDALGRPYLFFMVEDEATAPATRMTELSHSKLPPLRRTSQPHIEDITQAIFGMSGLRDYRVYRLAYSDKGSEPPVSMEISCGAEPAGATGRNCSTPIEYRYREGLLVRYSFRQDKLPVAQLGPLSPSKVTREPDGVLTFDMLMRR